MCTKKYWNMAKSIKIAENSYFFIFFSPKNKYFQKPILLPIYIFQGCSFKVSYMKIYFFYLFSPKGPPLFFENFDQNKKAPISDMKKIETDFKSVGHTLSFAPWALWKWNHPSLVLDVEMVKMDSWTLGKVIFPWHPVKVTVNS